MASDRRGPLVFTAAESAGTTGWYGMARIPGAQTGSSLPL